MMIGTPVLFSRLAWAARLRPARSGRSPPGGGPRETRYWLLPRGDRLLRALDLLDTWYGEQDPGTGGDAPSG